MSHSHPRPLVDGAMLSAIATLLVLGAIYVPIFGSILLFVSPTPIVLAYYKHGGRLASLSLAVVAILVAMFAGPLNGLIVVMRTGLLALVFGYGLVRKLAAEQTVLLGAFVSLVNALFALFLSKFVLGIDFIEHTEQLFLQSYEMLQQQPWAVQEGQEELFNQVLELVRLTIPAMILFFSITFSYLNYVAVKLVLERLQVNIPPLPAFRYWQLPRWSFLGIVAAFLLMRAYEVSGIAWYQVVGYNLFILFFVLFFVQGLSLAYYLLMSLNLRPAFAVVLLIFLSTTQTISVMLVFAGFTESLWSIRSFLEAKEKANRPPVDLEQRAESDTD